MNDADLWQRGSTRRVVDITFPDKVFHKGECLEDLIELCFKPKPPETQEIDDWIWSLSLFANGVQYWVEYSDVVYTEIVERLEAAGYEVRVKSTYID